MPRLSTHVMHSNRLPIPGRGASALRAAAVCLSCGPAEAVTLVFRCVQACYSSIIPIG